MCFFSCQSVHLFVISDFVLLTSYSQPNRTQCRAIAAYASAFLAIFGLFLTLTIAPLTSNFCTQVHQSINWIKFSGVCCEILWSYFTDWQMDSDRLTLAHMQGWTVRKHNASTRANVFSRLEIRRIFSRTRRRIWTSGLHDRHHNHVYAHPPATGTTGWTNAHCLVVWKDRK